MLNKEYLSNSFWLAAGARLEKFRERSGLRPHQIAHVVGISTASYYDLEEQVDLGYTLSVDQCITLLRLLNITPQQLFSGENVETVPAPIEVLHDASVKYFARRKITLSRFEYRVGYAVGPATEWKRRCWNWNLEILVRVCLKLDCDWIAILAGLINQCSQAPFARWRSARFSVLSYYYRTAAAWLIFTGSGSMTFPSPYTRRIVLASAITVITPVVLYSARIYWSCALIIWKFGFDFRPFVYTSASGILIYLVYVGASSLLLALLWRSTRERLVGWCALLLLVMLLVYGCCLITSSIGIL